MARMKKKRIKERKAKAKKWKMEDKGLVEPENANPLLKELLAVSGARYEEVDGKITIYHPCDAEDPQPHFHVLG